MLKLQLRKQPGQFVKLSTLPVTIGRDESNNFVIDAPSVSDFHAEVVRDAERIFIVDLLSASGTYVNEKRISKRCELKAWDQIRVGSVELEVNEPHRYRPGDWALRTESKVFAGQFYPLQSRTVVGRDPDCDLTIDCQMLSRRHAEIFIEADHLRVVDLESVNGTFLNGAKITQADARPGDELSFDEQTFFVMGPALQPGFARSAEADHTAIRGNPDQAAPADGVEDPHATVRLEDDFAQAAPPGEFLACLEEQTGTLQPPRFDLWNPVYLVGRDASNDLVLLEASVSGRHARLTREGATWHIEDCQSRNGLTINGERLQRARLKTGDRLGIGRLEFVFTAADGTDDKATAMLTQRWVGGDDSAEVVAASGAAPSWAGRNLRIIGSVLLAGGVVVGLLVYMLG